MKQIAIAQFKIGDWVYDPTTLTVQYGQWREEYELDLEKCSTSPEMLDWIFQFASKSWATNQAIGDLVTMLNQLLRPQATLCSSGTGRRPLPTGHKLSDLIANNINERKIMERWGKWLRKKNGTKSLIVRPEDWQELHRLEREELKRHSKKNRSE